MLGGSRGQISQMTGIRSKAGGGKCLKTAESRYKHATVRQHDSCTEGRWRVTEIASKITLSSDNKDRGREEKGRAEFPLQDLEMIAHPLPLLSSSFQCICGLIPALVSVSILSGFLHLFLSSNQVSKFQSEPTMISHLD